MNKQPCRVTQSELIIERREGCTCPKMEVQACCPVHKDLFVRLLSFSVLPTHKEKCGGGACIAFGCNNCKKERCLHENDA